MDFTESLFFSSSALNRQLNKMADDAFRELGLTSSYAFLLMLVNDQPGIQPMELSKKLQLTPSTITRLVEKMEYRGYLNRRSEGRATHIEITEKGEKIYPKLEQAWNSLKRKYTSILGERYTTVLAEMTYKASGQIEEAE
ncbi:MAG: MarR family transcriptional regulator [Balneolaceae bacterium]|nr:MarR family transcriptional regulator [Balneolaceae bacterium]